MVMAYLTVQEFAQKWNLSERMVQQLCVQGRIEGARKFGRSWAIPADEQKPAESSLIHSQILEQLSDHTLLDDANLMPLMNTAFMPGQCRAMAEAMAAGPQRDIALAEYHYFCGQSEMAAKETEDYLTSHDMGQGYLPA